LSNQSHFKQPLPFEEETIKRKIHQTYRLQFLKDVVLTRVLEDSTFTVLNSCIIFNQIDLINHFTSDEVFLRQVVNLFVNPTQFSNKQGKAWESASATPTSPLHDNLIEPLTLDERRRDVIYLIQQLCVMGKNVQLQTRLLLFRALVDRGFVHAVQWSFSTSNDVLMSASAEILAVLLDHDINGIRNHIMRQAEVDINQSLISVLSNTLSSGRGDQALRHQLADCLKSLLETQLPECAEGTLTGIKATIRQREDPIIEKFLEFVYSKGLLKVLFRALYDMPEYKVLHGRKKFSRDSCIALSITLETPLILTNERSMLYFHLLEILCCVIQQHGFRSTHFLLDSGLSPRIASLLCSGEKHLRLGKHHYT
jgi:protein phosphatase 4 regulatory subunit 3